MRKVRRRLVRVTRHAGRDLARWRPTLVVGALLVGAVLGVSATGAIAAVSGSDEARADRGVITQHFESGADHWHPGQGERR